MDQKIDKVFDSMAAVQDATIAAGADDVEVIMATSSQIGASVRLGKPEELEENNSQVIGIRAFVNGKQASTTLPALDQDTIKDAAEFVVTAAKMATTTNPNAGLADASAFAKQWNTPEIFDPRVPTVSELLQIAGEAEDAALQNKRVTISDGASASRTESGVYIITSNGFQGHYKKSRSGLQAVMVAEQGDKKERGGEGTSAIFFSDLESPADIGRKAAEQTVAKLGARAPKSGKMPVVYHPDTSAGILGHFVSAISGRAVMLKQTFLLNAMGQQVLPKGVKIVDDPTLDRGLGTKPFDAEGLLTARMDLADDGVLQKWLLDIEAARALGLPAQGNATGGPGANPMPAPSNVYMSAGDVSPEDLIADMKEGVYITHLFSQGVNLVNGSYNRAATGFMIENGEITHPVSNFIIAGNLPDMFMNLVPADDIDDQRIIQRRTAAPTLRINGMHIAGV